MPTAAPRTTAPATSTPRPAPPPRRSSEPSKKPAVRTTLPPAILLRQRLTPPGMFLTGDDKLIELPPDLTLEEAVRLEFEGKAAEKKLGKGPAPKPVPDVKKLSKKEEKPKPKAAGKGGKGARGKGKAGRKFRGGGSPILKGVGAGKVAQYLAAKAGPVLLRGFGRLQKLRQNEQTHDDAGEKLTQTEKAVVIPVSEGQSKSNAGQVTGVSDRPAPVVDENKGKQKLQEKLAENIPKSVEDVDNFKRDKKAQHTGADVMKVVQGDKDAVVSTFQDMGHTPPPAPREHEPENLPPQEVAPSTAGLNLGQGAIAPLQKEHTDVSNFTKEADGKLKEEGVTQEQLDMVDSGDLAKANQEKKGMEKAAKTEPLAVQKFAQQETAKVDKDLKQEETKQRNALKAQRKAGLGATAQKQKKAKSDLEKKREEVAARINGIYTAAQDKVKKKLADLETQAMKRFDEGNAAATKEFEDTVNSELAAFKADRYSGWFGWARKARDWWKGMDDLPEVEAIFSRNRSAFVKKVDTLVENISKDNKRVIQDCKDELLRARAEIKTFVESLKPGLQDIGKKAAEEMNSKLDAMDEFIAKKEEDLQNQLKDKQTAAIKAIDEKIEKMKEAMAGALAKLGKLLLWAAKKFFTWALEKFGFSLSDIESIISKGAAVLKAIFTGPIKFVKNLIKAASTGFTNFGKNFIKHLKNAVFEWLTGSLDNLKLPDTWDLKGILSVIFQVLGLTYDNIRRHLVKYIPEPVIKGLETTFELVKTLIKEGPMAAWEQLKEIGTEMKEAFVNAVKDWIKWKVVEEAIKTVLSMFIPGAGIVRAIIGIYDTIVFFIQKAKDIMRMIGSFLGSIAEIAAGNIGAAATALEEGLARGLVLVIDFLARFLRLSGITAKIREVLNKLRGKVDGVLDKVAKWITDKAKKFFGKRAPDQAKKVPDARSPEEKRRDLDRAVAGLRPQLEPILKRGIPPPVLKEKMQAWKKQYRLTELALVDGKIRATINPQIDMFSPAEVMVGARLEAILRDAEEKYLRFVKTSKGTDDSRKRLAAARACVTQGAPLPQGLTQDEMVALIREMPKLRKDKHTVKTPDYDLTVTEDGRLRVEGVGFYIYRHVPGMAARTQAPIGTGGFFQRGALTWAWAGSVNDISGDPKVRGLRDHIEVARAKGNLPTSRISLVLVDLATSTAGRIRVVATVNIQGAAGVVSEAEITFGRLAPMATSSSAKAGTGAEASQGAGVQDATEVRQATYAIIFKTLSEAVKATKDEKSLVTLPNTPAGAALRKVAEAYDEWMGYAFKDDKARPRRKNVNESEARLCKALVELLKATR